MTDFSYKLYLSLRRELGKPKDEDIDPLMWADTSPALRAVDIALLREEYKTRYGALHDEQYDPEAVAKTEWGSW
jgi:hypothetical protein